MDQVKIGKFIQSERKEKGLTQREVADTLGISDKTVSKWECGNGLPDVSLMLPLCELLGISVNELLCGELLDEGEYRDRAEGNIMKLIEEKQESKKKIVLSALVCLISVIAGVTIILLAGLFDLEAWVRVTLIVIALFVMLGGIAVGCILDMDAGYFECRHCGERFVPDAKNYIMGAHTLTLRKLTCPNCGKRSYCKRRLSRK